MHPSSSSTFSLSPSLSLSLEFQNQRPTKSIPQLTCHHACQKRSCTTNSNLLIGTYPPSLSYFIERRESEREGDRNGNPILSPIVCTCTQWSISQWEEIRFNAFLDPNSPNSESNKTQLKITQIRFNALPDQAQFELLNLSITFHWAEKQSTHKNSLTQMRFNVFLNSPKPKMGFPHILSLLPLLYLSLSLRPANLHRRTDVREL